MYEGDDKVKQEKMQNLKTKFETLRMRKDEDTTSYMHRVDKVFNSIRGLGGKI